MRVPVAASPIILGALVLANSALAFTSAVTSNILKSSRHVLFSTAERATESPHLAREHDLLLAIANKDKRIQQLEEKLEAQQVFIDAILKLSETYRENNENTGLHRSEMEATTVSALLEAGFEMNDTVLLSTAEKVTDSDVEATTLSAILEADLEMDEETTDKAFWAVVKAIDHAEAEDMPLSADVPRVLHRIFDADLRHLQSREKITTNITCMQPDDAQGVEGAARRMNYIFDDSAHKDLPLKEGRCCEGGNCCDKCSRNIFPTFATDAESNFETFPGLESLSFNNLKDVSSATILQFVRLIERVRRTMAYEYGLPLKSILPLQAYSRKYVAGTTQQGGGGGEGDFVTLHTDEATHSGYHYSSVLYLSTQGEDFEGGNFVFNDPAKTSDEELRAKAEMEEDEDESEADRAEALIKLLLEGGELPEDDGGLFADEPPETLEEDIRRAGRELTPFHPTRGAAVVFSSGWENMHEVEKITSGTRYAVPAFFTTCPVPDQAYEQMAQGKPKTDDDIADDWLHLLLAHQEEEPIVSAGRVKELLMMWHYICTPLSEH